MTDITAIFRAGLTHRWHANPFLASSCDRLDGHQGRVARLCLAIWPDASRDLIIAALTHDDGESVTGDIPAIRAKSQDQNNAEEAERIKLWWNTRLPRLSDDDERRLRFCDKLDAVMWMMHHAPQCKEYYGWPEAIQSLNKKAKDLGLEVKI